MLTQPTQWFLDWIHGDDGTDNPSGVHVGHDSAMKYTPFWAAVRIISGTLAALPFKVYERMDGEGKKPSPNHPIYSLIHDRPNGYMDAVTFMETRQAHVLTYGNGYAEIQRDGAGRPVALWPLMPQPERTQRRISEEGMPFYQIRTPAGEIFNLPDYNVLHIKGLGFDGYTGYDVVAYHKDAIGYGKAVKEFGARFFSQGANISGVVEHPNALGDKAYARLKESLKLEYGGLSKAHRLMILEEGMKLNKTGVEPEKAQALEVQKWTVDDCSRIFQIPPHKLGSMEFSKYNNVEQLQLDFICTTMLYWFKKWEQECNYKLFMPSERGRLFCEILVEGLVRGDMKSRYESYNIGRNAGFLCVDDIREKENMNPLPDGKGQIFLEPLNMKPAGTEDPPTPSDDGDAMRAAHRRWLTCQWQRIITKQVNALANGANGDFYNRHRDYARKLLAEPAGAYADHRGLDTARVQAVLDAVITEQINPQRRLDPSQAGLLAERIIEQMGGHYAL